MKAKQRKGLVALALSILVIVAATYFFVIRFQRELVLVAEDDVKFYDGQNSAVISFELNKGESAKITRCIDKKSVVEPGIRLSNGKMAYVLAGKFRIQDQPTGLFSLPRYLGCPGR